MMDLTKTYRDRNGKFCTILRMVEREPEWAANRIQEGERAIERMKAMERALHPFAEEASYYEPREGDDHELAFESHFTMGDLRRAYDALYGKEAAGG